MTIKRIIVLLCCFIIFLSGTVYAIGDGQVYPEIDGWKNGSSPDVNGSAVEYNGLRIGNTVWCKPEDILGVTAWGKVRWKYSGDWDDMINHAYLTLDGTDNFSKWWIYDSVPPGSEGDNAVLVTDSSTDDVMPVDAEIGHSSAHTLDGCWHCGNLFWLEFCEDNRTYIPRCNFYTFNENWLTDEHSVFSWPRSIETIKTDGDAPDVTITPASEDWTNKDVKVDINIKDSGCGIQKYRYSISKDEGMTWQDYDWIYAKDASNLDNTYFEARSGNAPVQLAGSENNLESTITLSDQGIYQIKVQAVDNLGNGIDGSWHYSKMYEIDKTKPTGTYDPDAGKSGGDYYDNLTVYFQPYDEGGSDMKNWRYRLSDDDGATWGAWSDYIEGDNGQDINLTSVGKWRIDAEAYDNAGNVNEIISGPYNIVLSLEAAIVPYDDPNFVGIPTLKKGQMAHLRIITRHYADHLSITFPYSVLPDEDALQNYIDSSDYSSFSNKEINIAEPEEEDDDSNGVDFIIPISKDIPNELENVHVKAHYQDGRTKEVWPEFKVGGSVTDHIKVSILP